MRRGAIMYGESCRLLLERGEPGRTAGWLMCNPSTADAFVDDPTAGRVMHHSARAGCSRVLIGNIWALRTPYPDLLWKWLARGDVYDEAMHEANLDALTMIGAQADMLFVAFGAEPWRRHRAAVLEALRVMVPTDGRVPLCLGMTADGAPLHPLARGKLAVRNDVEPFDWPGVLEL